MVHQEGRDGAVCDRGPRRTSATAPGPSGRSGATRWSGLTPAFTLVELLVVIGILALLAALLYPVVANARRRAAGVPCISSLRQIGAATSVYIQDYDGMLPNGTDGTHFEPIVQAGPHVCDQLAPFTRAPSLFECPLDTGSIVLDVSHITYDSRPSRFAKARTSYVYQFAGVYPGAVNYAAVAYPASEMAFSDGSGAWHSAEPLVSDGLTDEAWEAAMRLYRYNLLHLDWHVRNVGREALMDAVFGLAPEG